MLLLGLSVVALTRSYAQEPATSIAVNLRLVNLNVALANQGGPPQSGPASPLRRMYGSWRAVQVQLNLPDESHKETFTVRTRSGYFAPTQ